MKLEAEDVARFLRENRGFFQTHTSLLTELDLPHTNDEKTVSLTEYQVAALREKNAMLEAKLRELIQFGEENDALGERVHRFSIALLKANSLDALLQAIYYQLREDFAVPHLAMRLWGPGTVGIDRPETGPATPELRLYAEGLSNPSCGAHALYETGAWFGASAAHLKSFAMVGLRGERVAGLLVLASEDPQRFYTGMGTLYLRRLGELISAALDRQLGGRGTPD